MALPKKLNDDDLRLLAAAVAAKELIKRVEKERFDMNTFTDYGECGTSHCIGGWMDFAMGGAGNQSPIERLNKVTPSLIAAAHSMFFNFPENTTPRDGIKAIDNFLAGHKNPWRGVKTR